MLLDRKNVRDMYFLTPMQEGILFHSLMESDSETYFEQFCFRLEGRFSLPHFFQAFRQIVARHDVFRTLFLFEKVKRPTQVVLREVSQEPTFVDLSAMAPELQAEYVADFRRRDRARGFDLAHETGMRMALLQLAPGKFQVVWSFHHILMDGWCLGIVGREFFQILGALERGTDPGLSPVVPFSRYVAWLEARETASSRRFWQQYLADYETVVELPRRLDSEGGEYRQQEQIHRLDSELVAGLTRLAKSGHVTINVLLQGLWGLLLSRYNASDEVVFGAIVSGRPAEVEGVEEMVGLFINAIPVRVRCNPERGFRELLHELSQASFAAEPHHYLPLATVQSESSLKQRLIHHVVAFENYPMEAEFQQLVAGKGDSPFRLGAVEVFERTNYDFNLVIVPGDSIELRFSFNQSVYDPRLVERIGRQFERLARAALAEPEQRLRDLDPLGKEEREQLAALNPASVSFHPAAWRLSPCCHAEDRPFECGTQTPETLHLFENQALTTPDRVALICGERHMNFAELDRAANRMAQRLSASGVRAGTMVAILLESGLEQVVSLLAVWKASAAYVPVDPKLPSERIAEYLVDSGALLAITRPELAAQHELQLPILDPGDPTLAGEASEAPVREAGPSRMAYMIYTSGSTGKPKGVLVSQSAIFNTLAWRGEAYGFAVGDVVLQLFSFTFDGFLTSALSPLIAGATIVQAEDEERKEPERLARLIREQRVNHFIIVPSFFQALLDHLEEGALATVRSITLAGEKVTAELIARCRATQAGISFYNEYGPTECAVAATFFGPIRAEDPVPIGHPIANTGVWLLDRADRLQPLGAPGEICLTGAGLAEGYQGRESLSAERFPTLLGYGRLYRTGDLGRWDESGRLHYLGRADDQVKIRGFRVELGEIESRLRAKAGVREAVVIARERQGKVLLAYVIPESGNPSDCKAQELRSSLAVELPDYMLPAFIMVLERLPLNSAGKVDKKTLPDPPAWGSPELDKTDSVENRQDEGEGASLDPIETAIRQVWAEVLGAGRIGPESNFFELGGDSIKAIQVVSRLKKNQYGLKVHDLFDNPTPATLRAVVKPLQTARQAAVEAQAPELLPIQRWFFAQRLADAHHWNQALMLRGSFEESRLRPALDRLVSQHEALRLCFPLDPAAPEVGERLVRFRPATEPAYRFERHDLRLLAEPATQVETLAETIQRGFNLETGPLFAVALFQVRGADHLLLVFHHLIVDGVSWRILLEDLMTSLKKGVGSDDSTASGDGIAAWSRALCEYATSEAALRELPYWLAVEAEAVAQLGLSLPVGADRRATLSELRHLTLKLDHGHTGQLLRDCSKAYHTQINDLLLSALGLALFETFAVTRVQLALEGHGREPLFEHLEATRTVGWLTSWFPLLLRVFPGDLATQIKQTKEDLRKIPNKGVGYGILRELNPSTSERLSATPELLFNYLGDLDAGGETLPFSEYGTGPSNSPLSEALYPLSINAQVQAGELQFRLDFDPRRFPVSQMDTFSAALERALYAVVQHCLKHESDYTPSDFGYSELGFEDLDAIGDALGNLLD